jgi:pimeloyl-ACP methyl ester carboxylesterase
MWGDILSLPIEARFARRAGVKPICSFIWDQMPEYIEIDGNTVAVHQLGPEDGMPILSFHGNPGSARGPHPTSALLEAEHIRWIACDTFGFGDSPPTLTDTPFATSGNVAHEVIKTLGYEKVAVLARSGGVPRALGFAALHSESISSMILVAGLAPPAADIEWQAGMSSENQEIFTAAQEAPDLVSSQFLEITERLMIDENYHINNLWPNMSEYDRLVFDLQPDLFVATAAGQAAGVSRGSVGWEQSAIALRHPWGFDLSDIDVPVLLIHGIDDPYVGIEHARWLQKNIHGANLLEIEGGHFASWFQIRKQLAYLRERHIHIESGVKKIGKGATSDTVRLGTAFSVRSSYDNYA